MTVYHKSCECGANFSTLSPKRRDCGPRCRRRRHQAERRQRQEVRPHTEIEWRDKLQAFNFSCAYCGDSILQNTTKDHDVPLSKGGDDSIGNILPCCWPCNQAKGQMTGEEFRRFRGISEVLNRPLLFKEALSVGIHRLAAKKDMQLAMGLKPLKVRRA